MTASPDPTERLAEASAAIVRGVTAALPSWVIAKIAFIVDAWGRFDESERADLDARTAVAATTATERVRAALEALFATPPELQRATPLEIVRSAVREVADVLSALGIPPVQRDAFDERAFPDDLYGVTPNTLSDLGDDALGPWQLEWGLAKAKVLRTPPDPPGVSDPSS